MLGRICRINILVVEQPIAMLERHQNRAVGCLAQEWVSHMPVDFWGGPGEVGMRDLPEAKERLAVVGSRHDQALAITFVGRRIAPCHQDASGGESQQRGRRVAGWKT